MNKITRHIDRPEYNTEEQREKEKEVHLKLRSYTKKVLAHHYLKTKKEASDTISRLISYWRFDVPGWTGDSVACPILHKTQDDIDIEQQMEYKKNRILGRGCKDKSRMTAVELKNEELKAKYDKPLPIPPRPSAPKKSNKEKVRRNAAQLIDQFRGTETAIPMMEAFEREDYLEVFELALHYDRRRREVQRMEKVKSPDRSEMCKKEKQNIDNKLLFRPHLQFDELFNEIMEENDTWSEPDIHATGHCSQAIKHLSGDLTYDDRALARKEMLGCLKSLKMYPQSTAPKPESRFDECTCEVCTNSRELSRLLKDIVIHSPPKLSNTEKKEIDKLFLEDDVDETPVFEEKLRDFSENLKQ